MSTSGRFLPCILSPGPGNVLLGFQRARIWLGPSGARETLFHVLLDVMKKSFFELQKHSSQAHQVHQDHQARRETKVGISCSITKVLEGSQHLRLKRRKGLGAEIPALFCL